jgi:hypothetical protein
MNFLIEILLDWSGGGREAQAADSEDAGAPIKLSRA